jgi:hypothetical protein
VLTTRGQAERDGVFETVEGRPGQRAARLGDDRRHLGIQLVGGQALQRIAVGQHQRLIHFTPLHASLHRAHQFLRADDHPRATVLGVIAQLGVGAHGVHRHHGGTGALDAVAGHQKLRAVLAQQQHTVTRLNAQALLQKTGECLHALPQPGVAQRGAGKHHGGLVGVALCGGLHVVGQGHARHPHLGGNAFRPERVEALLHRCRLLGRCPVL